jgi:carbon storage regulator
VLILGRRVGESILIDGGITIVVLACDRGGVRLGVRAPAEVTILRGEIVDQVTAENRRAAAPAGEVARALAAALRAAPAEPGGGASA